MGLGGRRWCTAPRVSTRESLSLSEPLSCAVLCINLMEFQELEPTCFQLGFMAAASSTLQLAGDPVALSPSPPAPPSPWVGGRWGDVGLGMRVKGGGVLKRDLPEGISWDHL